MEGIMDWFMLALGIVIGVAGILIIEHGWGWVLAKIRRQ
jgi:hypothetical protein